MSRIDRTLRRDAPDPPLNQRGAARRSLFVTPADWLLIIIASVAGIASATYLVSDGFRRATELTEAQHWETHTLGVIATAEQTRSAIRNMQRGELGYLLTSNNLYLQPYLDGRRQAQSRIDQLRRLTQDNNDQVATVSRLASLVSAIEERFSAQIANHRSPHSAERISAIGTGEGENLIRAADVEIDRIVNVETSLLAQRRQTLRAADAAAWQNRLALSVLGMVAVCAVLWLLLRGVAAGRTIQFERERAELAEELVSRDAQLAEQMEELNALYASAPIGLAFFSKDHRYLRVNEELARMNGRLISEHIGRPVAEILKSDAKPIEDMIDIVFETGHAVRDLEFTAPSKHDPHEQRHWLTGVYPVKNDRGDVEAVGLWVIEISERKRAEEREALLAREVDHRAKNLLAVVQSVVQLTQADNADDLKSGIVGRIQALARAHSLLAESRWDGAQIDDLVREELAPYMSGSNARAGVSGPPLMLRPAAAQSLGIVLHELATNAVKYGALADADGELAVNWRRDDDQVEITWNEHTGRTIGAPTSSGFGSKIIKASIERQLHGSIVQDWRPEGLQCTIRISAREALRAGEQQTA